MWTLVADLTNFSCATVTSLDDVDDELFLKSKREAVECASVFLADNVVEYRSVALVDWLFH